VKRLRVKRKKKERGVSVKEKKRTMARRQQAACEEEQQHAARVSVSHGKVLRGICGDSHLIFSCFAFLRPSALQPDREKEGSDGNDRLSFLKLLFFLCSVIYVAIPSRLV
jgi:hypothetical protein